MTRPRSMTSVLLSVVAIAAADCALLRNDALFRFADLTGFVLSGLVLQVGFVALAVCRGRSRFFWVGFEAAGLLTLLVYELTMVFSPDSFGPVWYHAWDRWVLRNLSLTYIDLFDYYYSTNIDPNRDIGTAVFLLPVGLAGGVVGWTASLSRFLRRGRVSQGGPDQPLTLPKSP